MAGNIKKYTYKTHQEALVEAGQKLSEILFKYKSETVAVLLLLSGGSALKILENIDPSAIGNNLTIGVLDERYSRDSGVNNFNQLTETEFYKSANNANASFIDTRILAGEKQNELAIRFEQVLKRWVNSIKEGKIIITQGIGADGHTSGILPFPENPKWFINSFDDPDIWVKAYDANNKNPFPLRVTTTLSFLKKVDVSILFVSGADKEKALRDVLAEESKGLYQTPGRIIHKMKKVFLYTDVEGID